MIAMSMALMRNEDPSPVLYFLFIFCSFSAHAVMPHMASLLLLKPEIIEEIYLLQLLIL
jgi:hypothetical protein